MLTIRLARGGAKKRPFYRIVAADVRAPRDGKYIERLGVYNPLLNKDDKNRFIYNAERVTYWLEQGAQMSERIHRLLHKDGFVKDAPKFTEHKRPVKNPDKIPPKNTVEAPAAEEAPAEDAA